MRLSAVRTDSSPSADEGLRALVDEHGGALYAYIVSRTGDRQGAEDVMQEVFLRAWRKAETFDPARGNLRGWLFAIARNAVIDAARAAAARPRTVVDESMLATIASSEKVEAIVDSWVMRDALAGLSPVHRQVLQQLYYRRLSIAEAAAESEVPPGTVKSRSTYALRALKLVLEEMETP